VPQNGPQHGGLWESLSPAAGQPASVHTSWQCLNLIEGRLGPDSVLRALCAVTYTQHRHSGASESSFKLKLQAPT
jgi:hypothetical protein